MSGPLPDALVTVRDAVLDDEHLVRALASGRRRGQDAPRWRRVELRYVDLKAGRRLQVTAYDDTQAHTSNHQDPRSALDELLAMPFANWHVDTTTATHQLRVTKKGEALMHSGPPQQSTPQRTHDQVKDRLLPEDHPVLKALGISDQQGRIKPSRQAKYRQVEEFVRALSVAIEDATSSGTLRTPTPEAPLRVVDLGCGNAYLTFAAHAWLRERMPVRLVGVDVKEQSRRHSTEIAESLGVGDEVSFVAAGIRDVTLDERPDVVLALHACDTATDDALARAVRLGGGARARGALLPPRHLGPAASGPCSGGLCQSHARRHSARTMGRHLDRRPQGGDPASGRLSSRGGRVRRERAHPAQHVAACGAHRVRPVQAGPRRVRISGVCLAPEPAAGGAAELVASWGDPL